MNLELTREQALATLRRSGERLMGLVENGAPTVLLANEVALACKRIHRLRELEGTPPDDLDGLLLAVHAARWERKFEESEESVVFDLDDFRRRQREGANNVGHYTYPPGATQLGPRVVPYIDTLNCVEGLGDEQPQGVSGVAEDE